MFCSPACPIHESFGGYTFNGYPTGRYSNLPAQGNLSQFSKRQSHLRRCLALRARSGRFKRFFCPMATLCLPTKVAHEHGQHAVRDRKYTCSTTYKFVAVNLRIPSFHAQASVTCRSNITPLSLLIRLVRRSLLRRYCVNVRKRSVVERNSKPRSFRR